MSNEPTHGQSEAKPEFGPVGLQKVVSVAASDPDLLAKDWRRFVREHFHLKPDQDESLQQAPATKVKEIQHFFTEAASHMRRGAKLDARIVKLPVAKQTSHAVHELHVDIETKEMTPQLSIVIAHCDANCRNWGWGPG